MNLVSSSQTVQDNLMQPLRCQTSYQCIKITTSNSELNTARKPEQLQQVSQTQDISGMTEYFEQMQF